jgi:endonuclease III
MSIIFFSDGKYLTEKLSSMTATDLENLANFALRNLGKTFPDAAIELNYRKDDPWQLLVVVALSAQTTDKKVNEISPKLFERFKAVEDFANADPKDIEPFIKSIGLYRNKAKNLVLAAKKVVEQFHGHVPRDRQSLETIAGVGRKTSAVIVANAFKTPAIAVDTHVARVSFRLGLTKNRDPNKIEADLTRLFAAKDLISAHHTFIFHGRRICLAKKPKCSICPLQTRCPRLGVTVSQ